MKPTAIGRLLPTLILAGACQACAGGASDTSDLPGTDVPEPADAPVSDGADAAGDEAAVDAPPPHPHPLFCDEAGLPCDLHDGGPNPEPYQSCSGAFYVPCAGGTCLPDGGDLQAFYDAWIQEAPSLLWATPGFLRDHVWVIGIGEEPRIEGAARWFWITFLVQYDWILVQAQSVAFLSPDLNPTRTALAAALQAHGPNLFKGPPGSVLPLSEVTRRFAECHPDMAGRYCTIWWTHRGSSDEPGFQMDGWAVVDAAGNQCRQFRMNLQDGSGDCVDVPCSIP